MKKLSTEKLEQAALNTHGIHKPSGFDADELRRLLTAFDESSTNHEN